MNRWVALAAVGLMLVVPVASAASFLQPGNGPERTGAIGYQGPATNDTAFEVQLPGVAFGQPMLHEGQAYVTTADGSGFSGETENLTENALWQVDLDTAEVTRLLDFEDVDGFPVSFGWIGSETLLMTDPGTGEVFALDIFEGEERWRTKALPDDPRAFRGYSDAVRHGDQLFLSFFTSDEYVPNPSPLPGPAEVDSGFSPDTVGVLAVDVHTGEQLWTWTRSVPDPTETGADPPADAEVTDPEGLTPNLATDGERVYLYSQMVVNSDLRAQAPPDVSLKEEETYKRQFEIRALSADQGQDRWARNDTAQTPEAIQGVTAEMQGYSCCGYPAITDTAVYIRLDAFQALNPANGETIEESVAGRSDQIDVQGSGAMGVRGGGLIATSPQTVYKLDGQTMDIAWQHTVPGQFYSISPVTIDEETVFVPTLTVQGDNFLDIGLEARDLATGELQWRWLHRSAIGIDDPGNNVLTSRPSYAPGVMVWPSKDGTVTVLGRTEASLGAPQVETDRYPGIGENLTLEVTDVEPGALGEATRYRVSWGDGTTSGWQNATAFSHAYEEGGNHTAHIQAANGNQTSSTFVTMNVGEEAPTEPNVIETAFARENQDLTFGILGILVAVTGGVIGVGRRYRKRSRLQEELEALEEGFERTKDNPGECEAFLDTRKARAQSLMLDGILTEEQFGVIESRVEELGRRLRTSVLDERFQFLPYGLVQSLKKMLADGKISSWEREAVETLLDDEDALSQAQREKVRHQLDRWLVEDAGGASA